MVAGADKTDIARVRIRQHFARVGFELRDIELVVGEQHMVLEMLGIGGGVMRQARQRIIDALGGEQGQRANPIGGMIGAIHDIIVGGRQIRHIKDITQHKTSRPFLGDGHIGASGYGKMHRDWRGRDTNFHGLVVIADQQGDLLFQIMQKQIRPGDCAGIGSRRGDMTKAEPAIHLRIRRGHKADLGVIGAISCAIWPAVLHDLRKGGPQKLGRLFIKLDQPGHGGRGIGEFFGSGVFGRHNCHWALSITGIFLNWVTSTRPRSEMRSSGITTSANRECCM